MRDRGAHPRSTRALRGQFAEPRRRRPGMAVFYAGERVLGGCWIEERR
jgi:hypothetical protein